MANITLHQALNDTQQKAIKRADWDCLVKYVDKFILEDSHLFGLKDVVFRYGMPGLFPNGEYGIKIFGDAGIYNKPDPIPGDYRVTMRAYEIPCHSIEFSGIYRAQCKITNYWDRDRVTLLRPHEWFEYHLAALAKVIPLYLNAIVYKMFVGTETAKESWYVKEWYETYVKTAQGDNNGHQYYNSDGFHEINLSKVITKEKNKDHKLNKRLEEINKALRNETRKVEVDVTKDNSLKTDWIKNNVTDEGKKMLALFNKAADIIQEALDNGFLDKKYKHKNESFEGFNPKVDRSNLIAIVSKKSVNILNREANLKEPFTGSLDINGLLGLPTRVTSLLDKDEIIIMHRELLQCWIMNQLSKYWVDRFKTDETTDYIYEITYSLDLIDVYPSVWVKLKP